MVYRQTLAGKLLRVEQHTDGYEKHTGQHFAQRNQVGQRLVTELTSRNDESRQECSQCDGDSGVRDGPGDTETVLSWLEVPGAASYTLYFSTSPGLTVQTATKIEGVSR